MARVQVDYNPGAEALQTTASPNLKTIQARFDPRASSAFQLAEALGKLQPTLDKFKEDDDRQKIQDQMMKLPAYIEQFQRDYQGGSVTAAQVGERFPETVPVIRARIAEGMGAEYGRKAIQPIVDQVMQDANLITDPDARKAFIASKRQELIGQIDPSNEFYASGAIQSIDKELSQWENSWQRESAKYHTEVQSQDFSSKVVSALYSDNPQGNLEALDTAWSNSSSLNNVQRKELVVETAIQQAFAGEDEALLDRIPQRFLNAELKAKIVQAKNQINSVRFSRFSQAKALEQYNRENDIRMGKTNIIQRFSSGEQINPAEFRNSPELFDFATGMMNAPRVPKTQSQAMVTIARNQILNTASIQGVNVDSLIDQVQQMGGINPDDKAKLIEEIPKLADGLIAMKDETVQSAMSVRLDARLKALEQSPNAAIQTLLAGRNLRSEVMRSFDLDIRRGFQAHYEETGDWPRGAIKQRIVDDSVDRAERLMESLTNINALKANPAGEPSRESSGTVQQQPVRKFNPATGRVE